MYVTVSAAPKRRVENPPAVAVFPPESIIPEYMGTKLNINDDRDFTAWLTLPIRE